MTSANNGGPVPRSGLIPIVELPQFDVSALLQTALREIDTTDQGVITGRIVDAARGQIVALLASQPEKGSGGAQNARQILLHTAKCLMSVKDRHVENARLALMSAADMLRTSAPNPIKRTDAVAEHQAEIPKVGSTDAPGG